MPFYDNATLLSSLIEKNEVSEEGDSLNAKDRVEEFKDAEDLLSDAGIADVAERLSSRYPDDIPSASYLIQEDNLQDRVDNSNPTFLKRLKFLLLEW